MMSDAGEGHGDCSQQFFAVRYWSCDHAVMRWWDRTMAEVPPIPGTPHQGAFLGSNLADTGSLIHTPKACPKAPKQIPVGPQPHRSNPAFLWSSERMPIPCRRHGINRGTISCGSGSRV